MAVTRRGMCGAVLLLTALIPSGLAGQTDSTSLDRCLARLPDSVFRRVIVYLGATPVDTAASRNLLPSVDLLTEWIAMGIRTLLGGAAYRVPVADSLVPWRHLGGELRLVIHADGRFSWHAPDTSRPTEGAYIRGTEVLERALGMVRDSSERVFVPEGAVRDSLAFTLSYLWPEISPEGDSALRRTRLAIPVFTIRIPSFQPSIPIKVPPPEYPMGSRMGGAEGTVILQFVIDTSGRAVMSTLRDLWPLDRPRLTGELGRHYEWFLEAATRSIEQARYEPARFGACRVKQLVQQPFRYLLRRP